MELGQHSVDSVERLADVLQKQEAVTKVRTVFGAESSHEKTQASP